MRSGFLRLMITAAMASLLVVGCQSAAPAPTAAPAAAPAPTSAPAAAAPTKAAAAATTAPVAGAPTAAPAAQAPKMPVPPTVNGQKWPSKTMGIDNAGNAGGGLDLFARSVGDALQKEKILPGTYTFDSHGGGGGNIGMSWLAEQKGNTHILMSNTNRVYLNPLMGTTKLGVDDFIPIARVATDYEVIAVKKDSPFKTAKDMIDQLKKDPKSVSIGNGTAPPSSDFLNVVYPCAAAGIDLGKMNIVVFNAGGDTVAELLGGHVDAVSMSAGEALPYYESGDVRFLWISAAERQPRYKDVPTIKEVGYDVVVRHWRALWGPKDLPPVFQDYWTQALGYMVGTPTWKGILEKNVWGSDFLAGPQWVQAVKDEAKTAESTLRPLGLLPPAN